MKRWIRKRMVYTLLLAAVLLVAGLPLAACTDGREQEGSDSTASSESSSKDRSEAVSSESSGASSDSSLDTSSGNASSGDLSGAESSDDPLRPVIGNGTVYVALGDSICRGYGLAEPEKTRYSTLLANQLGYTVYNYGVDGQTGKGLIDFLRAGNAPTLEQADFVTVSIGANNILQASYSLLQGLLSANAGSVNWGNLLAPVDAGIAKFETELPELMTLLHELAPDAKIVFQTVYNPYRDFDRFTVTLDGKTHSFASFVDSYIAKLNRIITEGAESGGYTVCDVHKAFEQAKGQLVNASTTHWNMDPHPNAAGHYRLAQALLPYLQQDETER